MEVFKDIKGYIGKYQISNLGTIKTLDRLDSLGRFKKSVILKTTLDHDGYVRITLNGDSSKKKNFSIHRLVMETFNPISEKSLQVNHIDGNKQNNNINNLEWITGKKNVIHSLQIGLRPSGEDHPNAKLTNFQVKQIPELQKQGYSLHTISKLYGVAYSTIKNINAKRKWNYL
jgi:hypothetical protein